MRFIILLFLMSLTAISARAEVRGTCVARETLQSNQSLVSTLKIAKPTDKYRFDKRGVWHSFEGRKEYFYNEVKPSPFTAGQYMAGNYRFIFGPKPYAIHADEVGWKVIPLVCALTSQ